jgi:ABC-type polysaccharide transport system permease subunit
VASAAANASQGQAAAVAPLIPTPAARPDPRQKEVAMGVSRRQAERAVVLPAPRRRQAAYAGRRARLLKRLRQSWRLYVLLAPSLLYLLVFKYVPMYGVQIAFRDYNVIEGFTGSTWVGLGHLERFVSSYNFWLILRNTLVLNLYQLAAGFPLPIVLALALNYVGRNWFKKTVQMVSYAPYFISTVVMVGIILQFLHPEIGLMNQILRQMGLEPIHFMGHPEYFMSIYVWSGVWQYVGFGSIIYLAALTSIDPTLHEAAIVDGATKLQRIWHIDVPALIPTITILLILAVGNIMNVGFEKVLLMQTSLNKTASQVIQTYVYEVGLVQAQYSFSAAVGLFNSVINLILLLAFNWFARRFTETSLW